MTLPDGQSNKGRVQAYDGPIYVADAALYLKYHNPELGITNPYDLKPGTVRRSGRSAARTARTGRSLLARCLIQMDDFKNEGVVASGSWPYLG